MVHNHLSLWKDTEKIETCGWCVRIRSPQTGFRSYTWINEIWMLDLGCFILQTFSSWTFFSSNRLGWNIARDGYFPTKYGVILAPKSPKRHWTVATEAVSNTFIIFTPMIWGFYDATSLKHNMFQPGGWFFKPTNWEMVRLEILSSGCTATAYSTGIYAPTDWARGHPVDGGITSGQQPENLNKMMRKFSWKVICRW